MRKYLFVLMLCVCWACTGEKNTSESSSQNIVVEEVSIKKSKKRIVISTKKELLTEGEIGLEILYPQFKSPTSELPALTTLNASIKTLIDSTLIVFKDKEQGINTEDANLTDTMSVSDADISLYKNSPAMVVRNLSINYQIHHQNADYIEIEFGFNKFTGGAHGIPYTIMLHYDLKSNKNLILKDLFVANSDYLGTISKLSAEDLMVRSAEISSDTSFINNGTAPKEENFKNFSVKNDTLKLIFDPYDVAPYAAGPQLVKIPIAKLDNIVDKNSLLFNISKQK